MAPTLYYVDPAINANSGAGTIGDPYGDVQYALNSITQDSTNGDQINVKAGTAEVLAGSLSLTTYGNPSSAAPLILRGYTSAANDGGIGEINGAGYTLWAGTEEHKGLVDLDLHTLGTGTGITMQRGHWLVGCKVHKGGSSPNNQTLVDAGDGTIIAGCHIYDVGSGTGARAVSGSDKVGVFVLNNHINTGAHGVQQQSGAGWTIAGNIVTCTATDCIAIRIVTPGQWSSSSAIVGNILRNTTAGTAAGISSPDNYGVSVLANNIVVGWSGVGGAGILVTTNRARMLGYNAFYNNTAAYKTGTVGLIDMTANDVALGADPFMDAANGDFSLTETAKTALRSLGWPASYLGSHVNTDPHITIGPLQYGPTPTADYPAVGDVQSGVSYGGGTYTGTFAVPDEADVRSPEGYGAAGTEFTGTLIVPAAADVEFGVGVDATTGLFVVPPEADVKLGTEYGAAAEFVGEYAAGGDPEEIAAAVRVELAVELARIDVATSTRMATAGYTAPLDAAGTRAALGLSAGNLDSQLSTLAAYVDTEIAAILAAVDTEIAAIKAKTDGLPAIPAGVGDAMTLANDAITAAKLAADAVAEIATAIRTELATELARIDAAISTRLATAGYTAPPAVGAVADAVLDEAMTGHTTPGTAGAALAAAGSAGDPWITDLTDGTYDDPDTAGYIIARLAGIDVSAVTQVAASNAGHLTITRTLSFSATVSNLAIPADWTACYWTVKRSTDDLDADALVQILVSNPGDPDDGVQVLMGTALEDESDGSLVVNQALGTVTIALGDASTALLEDAVELVWDVKVHAPGAKTQPGAGTATITTAVTRA